MARHLIWLMGTLLFGGTAVSLLWMWRQWMRRPAAGSRHRYACRVLLGAVAFEGLYAVTCACTAWLGPRAAIISWLLKLHSMEMVMGALVVLPLLVPLGPAKTQDVAAPRQGPEGSGETMGETHPCPKCGGRTEAGWLTDNTYHGWWFVQWVRGAPETFQGAVRRPKDPAPVVSRCCVECGHLELSIQRDRVE